MLVFKAVKRFSPVADIPPVSYYYSASVARRQKIEMYKSK